MKDGTKTNWNPVLNKFVEIKNEYKRKIGYITYYYKDGYTSESETCVERWVNQLNGIELFNQYKEYEDLLSCLEMNQYNNMIIVRYGRYSNVYDGETEASGEDFWDRYDGFYRECRSVVIDIEKECIVLCPFAKFFNINELEETSLENIQRRIDKAKVIEFSDKLDGSMQSARWYEDKIIMAGSQAINPSNSWRLEDGYRMINSLPGYKDMLKHFPTCTFIFEYISLKDASQAINPSNSWRLEDGYRMINSLPGYKDMLKHFPTCTFIFEYISLKDAHVVKYKKEQEGLYLIGIRDVNTGVELPYRTVIYIANEYHIPTTKLFDKNLDEIMSELDDKKSDEAEGFVVNIDGFKVKIKYNDYTYIHKALSKLSSINLVIRSIADDKYDDLLSKLPIAYHENVKKVSNIVFNYIKETRNKIREYYNAAPKNNKKDFMVYVDRNVPKQYKGYCRDMYYGKMVYVDRNVPKQYKGYCRDMYYGKDFNVIKSYGETQCPHYKKLKDMGVENYNELFWEDLDE